MHLLLKAVPRQDSVIEDSTFHYGQDSRWGRSFLEVAGVSPFAYAVSRLVMWRRLLGGIVIFKFGIAASPRRRYHDGYRQEGFWQMMDVVLCTGADSCRLMERKLIAAFREVQGIYNVKPGGEGVREDRTHTCYVYMVLAEAGHGKCLTKAAARRRREGPF